MGTRMSDDEFAALLGERLRNNVRGRGVEPAAFDEDVRGLLQTADLVWESQQTAPPLEDDPLAAMLGLVPDPEIALDGKALTVARKRQGISVTQLAARLVSRGWDVTNRDVVAWEANRGLPLEPALISATASELGVTADVLHRRISGNERQSPLVELRQAPAFQALVERWARIQGTSLVMARSALEARLSVAVHRGEAPDVPVLLDSLEAMMSAIEEGR